jgi:hypothetical protein
MVGVGKTVNELVEEIRPILTVDFGFVCTAANGRRMAERVGQ